MRMRSVSTILALAMLSGCAHPEKEPLPNNTYLRGSAKVVSISAENGHAVLDYEGRQVNAYWQTEVYLAQGGAFLQNDRMKPPVGQYAEPVAQPQTIHAKAGDTIAFVGMTTPSGILLRAVTVVGK
jgi:hypothetical protein